MHYKTFTAETEKEARRQAFNEFGTGVRIKDCRKIIKRKWLGLKKEIRYELIVIVPKEKSNPAKTIKKKREGMSYLDDLLREHETETPSAENSRSGFRHEVSSGVKSSLPLPHSFRNHPAATQKNIGADIKEMILKNQGYNHSSAAFSGEKSFDIGTVSEKDMFKKKSGDRRGESYPGIQFDTAAEATGNGIEKNDVYYFLKDLEYSEEIINAVQENCSLKQIFDDESKKKLAQTVASLFHYSGEVRVFTASPNVIFLVGPTGVGKTTTLAKISSQYVVTDKDCLLGSYDYKRVKAIEQMRQYALLMGIPFEEIEGGKRLVEVIKNNLQRNLIFVDICGVSQKDQVSIDEVAEFTNYHKGLKEIHLCLTASLRKREIEAIVHKFKPSSYDRVIITKADESDSLGTVLSVIYKDPENLKISYITYGQDVPHDVITARPETVSTYLFQEWKNV